MKNYLFAFIIFALIALWVVEDEPVEEKPKVTKTVQQAPQLSEAQQNVLRKFNTFESHVNEFIYMNQIERKEVNSFFDKKYMIIHPEEYNDSFVRTFKNAAKTYINLAEASYVEKDIFRAYSDSEELLHAIEAWLPEIPTKKENTASSQ